MHERWHLHVNGHLQARRRPEHGSGSGAEPSGTRSADFAQPGSAARGDGEEEVTQRTDDCESVFARR